MARPDNGRPTGAVWQHFWLLMLMLEVLERQIAAGERRNYIGAASVVAPILNDARARGAIATQTSRESDLRGAIVRRAGGKWTDAQFARYKARMEKKIARLKPPKPWTAATVYARYRELRDPYSTHGRALWKGIVNPDELAQRLKCVTD